MAVIIRTAGRYAAVVFANNFCPRFGHLKLSLVAEASCLARSSIKTPNILLPPHNQDSLEPASLPQLSPSFFPKSRPCATPKRRTRRPSLSPSVIGPQSQGIRLLSLLFTLSPCLCFGSSFYSQTHFLPSSHSLPPTSWLPLKAYAHSQGKKNPAPPPQASFTLSTRAPFNDVFSSSRSTRTLCSTLFFLGRIRMTTSS
jgi:hypothetical protein